MEIEGFEENKFFCWKIFLNRLATIDQLKKQGLKLPSIAEICVLCSQGVINLEHLFFTCQFPLNIWDKVGVWIGCSICYAGNASNLYLSWWELPIRNDKKGIRMIIWLSVAWSLWKLRNDIIFNSGKCNLIDTLGNIRFSAWKWSSLGDISNTNSNFYNFCMDPYA